ncbi:MAG TPA: type II secretion system F family protein [Verrucomicrobiae bacterium]|jgi:type II secretory pathway component PulF
MKLDEFAFLNQQLAGMLKAGLPLEAALRQMCAGMRRNRWRGELERLQADLSEGLPLDKALESRRLPGLYKQMVRVGAKSNNLPGLLTLLADHYQKTSHLWTRLKGLMIYPVLVLLTALGLSLLLISQRERFASLFVLPTLVPGTAPRVDAFGLFAAGSFMPALVFGALAATALLLLIIPPLREAACWRMPGFKEAHLSRLASSLSLLLKGGVDLGAALALMGRLESGRRIRRDLTLWERALAEGAGKLPEVSKRTRAIPPLFFWLAAGEGEDLPMGFARAAEIYYARAAYKADLLLNSVLPVSVVGVGLVIVVQIVSTVRVVTGTFDPGILQWL